MNSIKILVIDDYASECVKKLEETKLLTGFTIEPWDYLLDSDAIKNDYDQNHYMFHDVVCRKLRATLGEESTTTSWLILLDFELYGSDIDINKAIHDGIFEALSPRGDVYLILYTSIAPEDLGELYDKYEKSEEKKLHLYRRALHLCFFTEPLNYYPYTLNVFKKQCEKIKGGWIDEDRWSQ